MRPHTRRLVITCGFLYRVNPTYSQLLGYLLDCRQCFTANLFVVTTLTSAGWSIAYHARPCLGCLNLCFEFWPYLSCFTLLEALCFTYVPILRFLGIDTMTNVTPLSYYSNMFQHDICHFPGYYITWHLSINFVIFHLIAGLPVYW